MSAQSIQESAETLLNRRGRVSTLCLSVMLVGAFSVSLMAGPANADDRRKDKDHKHSLVAHPYSEHSLRNMVMQLQLEVENLKKQIASTPGTGTSISTGPSLADFEALKGRVSTAEGTLNEVKNNPALGLKDYLKIEATMHNGLPGPHIIFTGANVHVRNGANATDTKNSVGNLVLGYNETATGAVRDGSHNLVSGKGNSFASFGGLVFGTDNVISGQFATILGGGQNKATQPYATVIGGQLNTSDSNYEITPMPQSSGGSSGGGAF